MIGAATSSFPSSAQAPLDHGGVKRQLDGLLAQVREVGIQYVAVNESGALVQYAQRETAGRPLPTTLAWHTGQLAGEPYLSKPGGGPGFHSNLRIYPQRRVASVYLCNQMRATEADIQRFSDAIDRALLTPA